MDANRLPFQSFELAKDRRSLTFSVQNRRWSCDLQQYSCAAADAATAGTAAQRVPANASVSPDGRWAVFIRDHNLWARDLAAGTETQLTTDGVADFGYATDNAGWTHSDRPVLTWSPDSRKIATFQHDARGVGEMHLVSTNVGSPRLQSWKYPVPGDSTGFRISRIIVDLGSGGAPRVVRLQMPVDAHRSTVSDHIACRGGTLCDAQWNPDGSQLVFVSSSRDHKSAWVRVADARTGEVRTLFEERMPTQVGDASLNESLWRVLPASNELIWWSQRDNWIHLYLYDLRSGRLKNRITVGEGNVNEIVRVDEKARAIYFMGAGRERGRDPYFQHLYRVGFDGRGQTLLTPENAHHSVTLSPDGRYFVDSYSTPDTPPVTVLRDTNGRLIETLERADISRLLATGWRPPTPIRMKARDGKTDVYGLMYTPSAMDSTKKYPIVNNIYPGPQTGSVGSRSFNPARGDHQALAELGFIVVQIDGVGTPGRSKAFADGYYGRMGDNTLPDQIAGMKELAARHSFIDIDRVGHLGALRRRVRHGGRDVPPPRVLQGGHGASPATTTTATTRTTGASATTACSCGTASATTTRMRRTPRTPKNLRGKLLLAHGAMDDNVPPSNTMLVVDALIRAGKDFDLLLFPQARHGYGADNNYMMRRRWDYFVRNLQGAEPPKEYQIGMPAGTGPRAGS